MLSRYAAAAVGRFLRPLVPASGLGRIALIRSPPFYRNPALKGRLLSIVERGYSGCLGRCSCEALPIFRDFKTFLDYLPDSPLFRCRRATSPGVRLPVLFCGIFGVLGRPAKLPPSLYFPKSFGPPSCPSPPLPLGRSKTPLFVRLFLGTPAVFGG